MLLASSQPFKKFLDVLKSLDLRVFSFSETSLLLLTQGVVADTRRQGNIGFSYFPGILILDPCISVSATTPE